MTDADPIPEPYRSFLARFTGCPDASCKIKTGTIPPDDRAEYPFPDDVHAWASVELWAEAGADDSGPSLDGMTFAEWGRDEADARARLDASFRRFFSPQAALGRLPA